MGCAVGSDIAEGVSVAKTRQPRVVLAWADVAAAAEDLDEDLRGLLRALVDDHLLDLGAQETPGPPGPWFLRSLELRGHVGVGEVPLVLKFPPAAGIVVISARNGTGKTSAADGLRHVLSGGVSRKYELAEANLHFSDRLIKAVVSNGPDDVTIGCRGSENVRWQMPDGTDQPVPRDWNAAYAQFNPVLLYPEISPVIDKPGLLHEFLKGGLPLDVLTVLLELVDEVRTAGRAAQVRVKDAYNATLALTEGLAAAKTLVDLAKLHGSLPAPDQILNLRSLAAALPRSQAPRSHLPREWVVDADAVERLSGAIRELQAARVAVVPGAEAVQAALAGLVHGEGKHLEDLRAGDVCPVCGTHAASWFETARTAADRLKLELQALREAEGIVRAQWRQFYATAFPSPLAADARKMLQQDFPNEIGGLINRWDQLASQVATVQAETLSTEALTAFAVESALIAAWYAEAKAKVIANHEESADEWARVRQQIDQWLRIVEQDRVSYARGLHAERLGKVVEQWTRDTRSALFDPISARVVEYWAELNNDSDLQVTQVKLSGGIRQARKVAISLAFGDTKVAPGPDAPKVLSTGQRNALTLATYLPRATQPDSPFRFLVLDDPIHAFDGDRVRYLARVLGTLSKSYQIIVLTHDERLWHELRALGEHPLHIRLTRPPGSSSTVQVKDVTYPGMGLLEDLERVLGAEANKPLGTEAAQVIMILTMCRQALDTEVGTQVEILGRRSGLSSERIAADREQAGDTRSQLVLLNNYAAKVGLSPLVLDQYESTISALNRAAHGGAPSAPKASQRRTWINDTRKMLKIIRRMDVGS